MADVFTTVITGMSAYPTLDNLTDVVFEVYWSYNGTDGTFNVAMSGATSVPAPDPANYIPYADLTEADVMGWVEDNTDPAVWTDYEAKMSAWLAAQHNPPVVNPPLPWTVEPAPEPTPEPAP
jgi:hypothetical protein